MDIKIDQLEHTVKMGDFVHILWRRVQEKGVFVTHYAKVLGARLSLDAEGEEMPAVLTLPEEKGTGHVGGQQSTSLLPIHGAPEKVTLFEPM